MQHTTARGVEPYDKFFGVGYEVGRKELSPYPRVNKLRKTFFDTEFYINSQRAMLVTESYRQYADAPSVIKCARALENILNNIDIDIYADELIVGNHGAPYKEAPIYPEFSFKWVIDEMMNSPFEEREHDEYYIDEKTKADLMSIADFWDGKTVSEEIENNLEWDDKKGSNMGRGLYLLNLYHIGGIGHFNADYELLMREGYDGIIKRIEKEASKLKDSDPELKEKKEFYEAQLIAMNASKKYISRHAELAEKKASEENDPTRKSELEQIAANCRQIAGGPARSVWEALQLWHFATQIILIESNGHSVSYGRMDQWLYPYYEMDMKKGVDKNFIQELIELAYIRAGANSKLRDKLTILSNAGRGWGGESLTIGGVKRDGTDATNDLTLMMVDASIHTRMGVPWLCVRVHENTPHELKVKYTEAIRAGYGHPKLYNDQAAIPAQIKKGRSLEEARDYAVVGCVEMDTPGKEFGWHDASYMNIAKVFEMACNGGRCISCSDACPLHQICGGAGTHLGPDFGNLATYKNIDELIEAFDKQMEYWTDRMCTGIEVMDEVHEKMKPTPYISSLFPSCIDNGKDMSAGGCTYNHTGPQACGIATIADGMSVVQQLIFEEKKTTGEELLTAVNYNWEGFDELYALVNGDKVHHYGNDDDYADRYAKIAFDTFCKHIENRTNRRGGTYTPGVYTVSANVGLGLIQAASIDGRKAFEPLSDNMGPTHTQGGSHDIKGPTAMLKSVTKMDHTRATNGTLLNWKVSPECMYGDTGRDNLIDLLDVYFDRKGMHSQINVMSSEMMKDALVHPELYKDMLVRVAGYSAYFVELSKPLQYDLIGRTEMSFV